MMRFPEESVNNAGLLPCRQRVTFSVTGTVLLPEPDVAVTVTVEVLAGVPLAVVPLLELVAGGGVESLLLQLSMPTTASVIKQPEARLSRSLLIPRLRVRGPTGSRTTGTNREANIIIDDTGDRDATGPPFVLIVNVVLTVPGGVTVGGLKLQAAPAGKPPQLNVTS